MDFRKLAQTETNFRTALRDLFVAAYSEGIEINDIKMIASEEVSWFDAPNADAVDAVALRYR